ncbi:MAG: hypothetical protein FJ272_00725, partial [Planctomycetes bacterium]|nr:hypothetical protein [Planctomycetota bacterium]
MLKEREHTVSAVVLFAWLATSAIAVSAQPQAPPTMDLQAVSLRVLFGLKDREPGRWDGEVKVSPGRVAQISFWRQGAGDELVGANEWKASTHRVPTRGKAKAKGAGPMGENGVLVTLAGVVEESKVDLATTRGRVTFMLREMPFGKKLDFSDGAVQVDRVPTSAQLTSGRSEEDFPSAAVGPDGTIWVAYVAFTHGIDPDERARQLSSEMTDFAPLAKATGGDRVWLMSCRDGQWSAPLPVTKGGEDLYKTALAVDGDGRVWVFWSANTAAEKAHANFDLFARFIRDGKLSDPLRLTTSDGSDINPVATTDSSGRVWLAWQGFRGNNSNIFAMRQDGERFGKEVTISDSPANEWDPAIAADRKGNVAIAWDSYAKGDYDVHLRLFGASTTLGEAMPIAASLDCEMRPSLAYDRDGRLWIAWEQSGEKWGKDYGALEKDGIALYQGRWVGMKVYADGQFWKPQADLDDVMPLGKGRRAKADRGKREAGKIMGEEEQQALGQKPFNGFPRMACDAAGRVWLAFRYRAGQGRSALGTLWYEEALYCDGDRWVGPIFIPNTDNLLDNRPALVAAKDGLIVVGSSDQRQRGGRRGARRAKAEGEDQGDPFDNDIFAAVLAASSPPTPPKLVRAEPEKPAAPTASTEAEDVKRIRAYRAESGGKPVRILRGEFHRHTEISGDGMNDGALLDMWRYGLDAAAMDWIGNGDHDNGGHREYPWWIIQKTTDVFHVGEAFVPMFTYERSVRYPEGHRNVVFAQRGVRTLPRLPKQEEEDAPPAPDTQMLYKYLRFFDGVCAVHTSGTDMGTDWRNNDP